MTGVLILFWISLFLIFYTHIGYPLVLFLINRFKKKFINYNGEYKPTVSLIISAYNEEKIIEKRLKNALELEYPEDKLEIIVTSDNSTDSTNQIAAKYAQKYENVKLYEAKERKGKTNAQNEAVSEVAQGDILAFSDANSMWEKDALQKLIRNFADENVGYVCGKLSYVNVGENSTSYSEGLYWKYELILRKWESDIKSITAGNGAIYAVRNEYYENIPIYSCHDSEFPFRMVRREKRAIYEEEALAYEKAGESGEDELKRRVRMRGRGWRNKFDSVEQWNPLKLGFLYSFMRISHRLFRSLLPFFHILLLLSSIFIFKRNFFFGIVFYGQLICYVLALIGFVTKSKFKLIYIPYYYCILIFASIFGLIRYLRGEAKPFWETADNTR